MLYSGIVLFAEGRSREASLSAEEDAAPAGGFREPALGEPDQRRPPGTTARAPVQRGLGSPDRQRGGSADER